ncbi:hypothetical protein [Streptococcus sp. 27098_8_91]
MIVLCKHCFYSFFKSFFLQILM